MSTATEVITVVAMVHRLLIFSAFVIRVAEGVATLAAAFAPEPGVPR